MNIQQPAESTISIDDGMSFVDEHAGGDMDTEFYTIQCPKGYVFGIDNDTLLAPEIRDSNGEKVEGRIVLIKQDRRGNDLSEALVYDGNLSQFDYNKMRNDRDFIRETDRGVVLNEHQRLAVYVIPHDSNTTLDHGNSRFMLGDASTSLSKPVSVTEKSALSPAHKKAVEQNTRS